jgi:hypothetical protein
MQYFFIILMVGNICLNGNALAETKSSTSPSFKATKCYFPKTRKTAPDWICNPQIEKLTFSAVGSAERSEAGNEFMEQMATADARTKLAKKVSHNISKKITSNNAHTGKPDTALIEKITTVSLEGTKVINKAYAPQGRLYVLIGLDEAGTERLYESVTKHYLKQKN